MKLYITFIVLLFSFGTQNINAQTKKSIHKTEDSINKKVKYVFLVINKKQLNVAIETDVQFKTNSNKIDCKTVACESLVKEFASDAELQQVVLNAVQKYELYVLIYMNTLKAKGFKTIIL